MELFANVVFLLHDTVSRFLVSRLVLVRKGILAIAILSLVGIFLPEFRKLFGNAAAVLFYALLFLSPLAKITRMRLLLQGMSIRREIGILMGVFAIVHVTGYFLDPIWVSTFIAPYSWREPFSFGPLVLLGIVSLALVLPLLLTSNDFSVRLFGGRNWKRVHWLVYPAFVAITFHWMFRRSEWSLSGFLTGCAIVAMYVLLKLLARRNFIAPLRVAIDAVASQYGSYHRKVPLVSREKTS